LESRRDFEEGGKLKSLEKNHSEQRQEPVDNKLNPYKLTLTGSYELTKRY